MAKGRGEGEEKYHWLHDQVIILLLLLRPKERKKERKSWPHADSWMDIGREEKRRKLLPGRSVPF